MKRFSLFIALSLCGMPVAHAADTTRDLPSEPVPEGTSRPGWAFQVTPYLWAAGLDGSLSPFRRGPTIDVDKSFSDVMDDLNFGGFVNLWGRYDRFIFSGDIMYVDTTDSHATGPLSAFQIPGLGVTIPPGATIDGKVDTRQFMATLQGGYRVIDTSQFTLDALAGARFWHISNDVTVTASHFAIGSQTATHDESFGWVDPVVGLRAFLPLTEKLSVQAQADVGGFGAGSDITWSVLATANYLVTDNLSVSAGYKALKVDYDRDGHVYDTMLSGPVLGMTWRF
ncbi:hypothetical protein [Agrobacterium sp. V1]|uniref:hypothetical protein n=1 Tax=Agrobacterium sp. V1 TaxID=3061957 RepID=UPI002672C7B8|nr:hypothetical protein [Agrobacterium sp. V1]MDO3443955.1 hypothetical protein [Agrobacterium sp. V1]